MGLKLRPPPLTGLFFGLDEQGRPYATPQQVIPPRPLTLKDILEAVALHERRLAQDFYDPK